MSKEFNKSGGPKTSGRLLPSVEKVGQTIIARPGLDTKVQLYLKKVRQGGGAVSARIAMAAARGILLKCDQTKLAEFGGHVELNRQYMKHIILPYVEKVQDHMVMTHQPWLLWIISKGKSQSLL